MSFTRKATFLATGGTSGLFIKSKSKKERIAKALEEQNRLAKKQLAMEAGERSGLDKFNDRLGKVNAGMERNNLMISMRTAERLHKKGKLTQEEYEKRMTALAAEAAKVGVKVNLKTSAEPAGSPTDIKLAPTTRANAEQPELKSTASARPQSTILDELSKIASLKEHDVLPEEQFEAMRTRLLAELELLEQTTAEEEAQRKLAAEESKARQDREAAETVAREAAEAKRLEAERLEAERREREIQEKERAKQEERAQTKLAREERYRKPKAVLKTMVTPSPVLAKRWYDKRKEETAALQERPTHETDGGTPEHL